MPEFPTLRHTISDIRMRYAPDRATAKGACSDFSYLYRSNLQHRHDPADRIHTTPPHPRVSPRHGRNRGPTCRRCPTPGWCISSSNTPPQVFRSTKTPIPTSARTSRPSSTGWSASANPTTSTRSKATTTCRRMPKSTLTGVELTIPVTQGRLNLGTWQGIYLCEFRNRASGRRIVATLIG